MSQEGDAVDEKRIYGETRDATAAYVASETGLARVEVSGDRVGRISLVDTKPARDVAGAAGRLLVAGDEDVLVGTDGGLDATGFGPAAAVGATTGRLLAARPDGRVATLEGNDWRMLGTAEAPRRFDGAYLASGEGVCRVVDDGLESLGLDDVRDVAAAGPYAATGDRLYGFAEGDWRTVRDGAAERVADVAYGEATYAVTVDGTVLVDADPATTPDGTGGWRHRALGLAGVAALAVP